MAIVARLDAYPPVGRQRGLMNRQPDRSTARDCLPCDCSIAVRSVGLQPGQPLDWTNHVRRYNDLEVDDYHYLVITDLSAATMLREIRRVPSPMRACAAWRTGARVPPACDVSGGHAA